MWHWLVANWGWLLGGMLFGGYFVVYVLAIRHQQASGRGGARLPCDRC